jgi:hypothetical protein
MSPEYEVGYGKPPKETQFQKGQSGNPNGRPPGSKNLKTDLFEELQESILVREGSTAKPLSKQRAMVKSLTMKAIKGDTRAASVVLKLILRFLDLPNDDGAETPLTDDEQSIFAILQKRFELQMRAKATSGQSEIEANKSGEPDESQ